MPSQTRSTWVQRETQCRSPRTVVRGMARTSSSVNSRGSPVAVAPVTARRQVSGLDRGTRP